jgi:hypothetical protein
MPKVYDCFSFNGEWDLLEIRIHTLDPVVDYFVIVESNHTHMGKPKKLQFNIRDSRIAKFSRKIRYILVTDLPNQDPWGNDRFQRNACLRGLWDADNSDLILVSDCDEIPKPEAVQIAKDHPYGLFGFQLCWYYCFLNNVNVEGHPPEIATVGIKYQELDKFTPDKLRWGIRAQKYPGIWVFSNCGWHFSYLMTQEQIIEKVQNFSHQEFNNPQVLSTIDPIHSAQNGLDLLGRHWIKWKLLDKAQLDLPHYVWKNWTKFEKHFLQPGIE